MANKTNKTILNLFSFVALIIVAALVVVNNLLPILGVNMGGVVFVILEIIKDLLILVVIGFSAYDYISSKTEGYVITFWVAVAVFVVGIILGIFR